MIKAVQRARSGGFLTHVRGNLLSSQDLTALPERVRAALMRRENNNEIVVRVLQLGIVLVFSILYSLAAKTSQATDFQPVPYVLTAYLFLSVIGLVWSMRAELPDWSVYCSILFDFMLLYGLMVSFHYQYEQPPSFILKAPTLFYVFIFISLRALRLEWKYVVAAGITAATGWVLVVIYVASADPQDAMITRDYVEYLTSNSLLVGAEVDKIIAILFVTGILALVVNGSSNLLVTAVREQMAADDFSRFFDASIAKDIRSAQSQLQAGEGERRKVAVINIDIRGFSALAAFREPSEVMQLLSAYQGRVVPILKHHGAIIDKFMGDGIMATFGIDDPRMPFSRLSMEAAEAILADALLWKTQDPLLARLEKLEVGIGIASGDVAFGAVGQGERLEMTVIGAPVNASAKFEKHNKTLGARCIVSRLTYDMAVENGYVAKLPIRFSTEAIEGIAEPQDIVILGH